MGSSLHARALLSGLKVRAPAEGPTAKLSVSRLGGDVPQVDYSPVATASVMPLGAKANAPKGGPERWIGTRARTEPVVASTITSPNR